MLIWLIETKLLKHFFVKTKKKSTLESNVLGEKLKPVTFVEPCRLCTVTDQPSDFFFFFFFLPAVWLKWSSSQSAPCVCSHLQSGRDNACCKYCKYHCVSLLCSRKTVAVSIQASLSSDRRLQHPEKRKNQTSDSKLANTFLEQSFLLLTTSYKILYCYKHTLFKKMMISKHSSVKVWKISLLDWKVWSFKAFFSSRSEVFSPPTAQDKCP